MRRACLALTLLAVLAGCAQREPTPEETTLTVSGQVAPDFTVTTLAGERFTLSEQRGKVVLVNFWATWCPPCREEIPHLEAQVWQRFSGEGFAMVALAREEDEATVRPFVAANRMSFPVAVDAERGAFSLYAEAYIPRNVVVGRDGTILFQSSGYDEGVFAEMVQAIAAGLAAG